MEEKKSLGESFTDLKGEFKKIIWPSRPELIKKTITVLIACGIVGALIIVFDYGFGLGLEQFTQLVGNR